MYLQFFEQYVSQIKLSSGSSQATGRCVFHDDKLASLSFNIATGLWTCHAGCGIGNIITFARRLGVQPPSQFFSTGETQSHNTVTSSKLSGGHSSSVSQIRSSDSPGDHAHDEPGATDRKTVARYVYQDENGQPLFRVCRTEPKGFYQQRYENGKWISGLGDTRRVIYHLPEILASNKTIIFCEGEKDVERLRSLSLVATTSPMGANSWNSDFSAWFKGKRVACVPDNDAPGKAHIERVAKDLHRTGALVKIIVLPGVPEKGDVSDFLDANGNNAEALLNLVRAASPYSIPKENKNPFAYFESVGLVLPQGKSLLPTEYEPIAKRTYKEITGSLERCTDAGLNVLEKINAEWNRIHSPASYDKWIGLLRDLHAACQC